MSGTATMPTVTNSTEVKSPTQLVWDYLSANGKLRGSGPTSADVRAALEANAQNPGLIKGLDNQAPPGPDPAASATSASSGNRNSSNGPISDQSNTSSAPGETARGSGEPTTSAAPSSDGDNSLAITLPAIAAAVLGGGSLGAMARNRMGAGATPTPGGDVPLPVDPGAGVPSPATPDVRMLPAPEAASPMEAAMQKALTGPGQQLALPPPQLQIGQSPTAGVEPVGPPGGMDTMPPRGPVEPVAPRVPFNSASPRIPPTAAEKAAMAARATSRLVRR